MNFDLQTKCLQEAFNFLHSLLRRGFNCGQFIFPAQSFIFGSTQAVIGQYLHQNNSRPQLPAKHACFFKFSSSSLNPGIMGTRTCSAAPARKFPGIFQNQFIGNTGQFDRTVRIHMLEIVKEKINIRQDVFLI